MPYLKTHDGIEIYYRDLGAGAPVVLIHGWPLNGNSWDLQSNFLIEHGVRVITYDRRGFGLSGHSAGNYDYDSLAADLHHLLEQLDVQGATLVGFSMGGGEVIRYLSRYGSSRVAKAVLVSAVPPFLLKTSDNPDGIDPKVFENIEKQLREDRPAFLNDFGPKFYGRSAIKHTVSESVLEWTLNMAFTGSLRSTLGTFQAWSMTDFREEMKTITTPIHIIHGTSDATVPLEVTGKRSLELLPNATLTEFNGEPHGLFITAADRLNQELLDQAGATRAPITAPKIA